MGLLDDLIQKNKVNLQRDILQIKQKDAQKTISEQQKIIDSGGISPRVEERIAERPKAMDVLKEEILSQIREGRPLGVRERDFFGSLTKGSVDRAVLLFKALGVPFERGMAAIANPMISFQRGDDAKTSFKKFIQGLKGERRGSISDVLVGAGAPDLAADVIETAGLVAAPLGGTKIISRFKNLGKPIIDPIRAARRAKIKTIAKARQDIDASIKKLDQSLTNSIDEAIVKSRPGIVKNLKQAGQNFADERASVIQKSLQKAAEEGKSLNIQNDKISKLVNEALDEIENIGIKDNRIVSAIKEFGEELAPEAARLVDQFGRPIAAIERGSTSIQKILNARTNVASKLSSSAKGTGQYTREDLAQIIFDNKINQIISELVPELKNVNAKYARFKQTSKLIWKVFKPKSEATQTKSGVQLVRRVLAGEKLNPDEARLLKSIEEGQEILPGLKGFLDEPRKAAGVLSAAKSGKADKIQRLVDKLDDQIFNLQAKASKKAKIKRNVGKAVGLGALGTGIGAGGDLAKRAFDFLFGTEERERGEDRFGPI